MNTFSGEISGFVCCLCKNSVREDLKNPVDIKIVFNEDVKNNTDSFGCFWSHAQCFHETFSKDLLQYIARMKILKEFDFIDCYACEQEIKEDLSDPIIVDIILTQPLPGTTRRYYNFWIHYDCLKNSFHDYFRGYLWREDKEESEENSTIAELS